MVIPKGRGAKRHGPWYVELMIRKRDFILFVLILIFLVMGIGGTVIYEHWQSPFKLMNVIKFSYSDKELTATVQNEIDNRQSNLERLRQKLASSEGISQGASNIDNVPEPAPVATTTAVSNRAVKTCSLAQEDNQIVATWPKAGVSVKEVEGARMVYEKVIIFNASTSSSTKLTTNDKPLLQLALNQIRGVFDNCISGQIVGITTTGGLILNNDTTRFATVNESTIIGYALDGFPIYGNKADVSTLDNCGGENSPLGYRYYLRNNENFVLGCFAGIPSTFIK
jgi:hypothetical protein